MRFTTFCVRFKTDKNDTKRCSVHRIFMKTMHTYMDRCRCAVVIWLWHKCSRLWGKMCAMRWGKIINFGVSYHPYSYLQIGLEWLDLGTSGKGSSVVGRGTLGIFRPLHLSHFRTCFLCLSLYFGYQILDCICM